MNNFKKRARNKRFSHIRPLIQEIVKPIAFDEDALKEISSVWASFDEWISSGSFPVSLKNGLLTVKVPGSAFIQEIQFSKDQIIKHLNTHLGEKMIKDIKFMQ
ncbi:MAG: DUF721 domain-containing protein [Desulfobacteraceae bacterium]|jgi:predicted nucleic acid-binding Zn ribbon protein